MEGAERGPSFLMNETGGLFQGLAVFYGNISFPAITCVLGMLCKTYYLPVCSFYQYNLWVTVSANERHKPYLKPCAGLSVGQVLP